MTTEAYRQDLANGLTPAEAEDAQAEREAFEQIERDSRPAPLLPIVKKDAAVAEGEQL